MARLVVKDLVKTLQDRERFFELCIPDFTLEAGDRKAIVGATGSGKTTAMDVLALASRPDRCGLFQIEAAGETTSVPIGGERRVERSLSTLRARHFGYVVQTSPLFSFLSLRDNVMVQQRIAGRMDEVYAGRLLKALGLERDADARPEGLSIGQRQRTAVARALAHKPSFLLCDEPTGALDAATAELCLDVMDRAAKACGAAILMITHEPDLARIFGFDLIRIERQMGEGQRSRAELARSAAPARRAA